MRLINADKYCEFLNAYPLEKAQDNFMTFYRDALQYTFECEVEAIPIEWIREWYTKHSPLIGSYVAYMLLDWEKENEQKM